MVEVGTTIVHCDPEIMGGVPVFVGTRVPVRSMLDHLKAGDTLDQFLVDFPSVGRDQAVAALTLAEASLQELLQEARREGTIRAIGLRNAANRLRDDL